MVDLSRKVHGPNLRTELRVDISKLNNDEYVEMKLLAEFEDVLWSLLERSRKLCPHHQDCTLGRARPRALDWSKTMRTTH
jgi:hypothetical protein